jgi:hypothetical protein
MNVANNLLAGNVSELLTRFGVTSFEGNCFTPTVAPPNPACPTAAARVRRDVPLS